MPRFIRSMFTEENLPKCGQESRHLGVRPPQNRHPDVQVDTGGNILAGKGGMSVAPSIHDLLPHLVPQRLAPICRGAAGSNLLVVWQYGEGAFESASLGNRLYLHVDGPGASHGSVQAAEDMPLSQLQTALCQTRSLWTRAETL